MQLKRNVTKSRRKKNERINKKARIDEKYRKARGELLEAIKAYNTAIEKMEKEMLKKALEEEDYERRYKYTKLIDFLEGKSIRLTDEDYICIVTNSDFIKNKEIIISINHKAENILRFYDEYLFLKNKKMSIRISEEHLAAIHRKAEQADMTFTDYVTKACLGRQIIVIDGLDDVLRQQKAIGRNLNQLTMLCNMGRVSVANLAEMKEQYAEVSAALTELLERKRWSDGNG